MMHLTPNLGLASIQVPSDAVIARLQVEISKRDGSIAEYDEERQLIVRVVARAGDVMYWDVRYCPFKEDAQVFMKSFRYNDPDFLKGMPK